MKLNEEALAYVAKKTMNIADLERVEANIEVQEIQDVDDKGEAYSFKFVEIEDIKYRIPNIVLEQMQGILKKLPQTTHFIVSKTGQGLGTRYQVLPAGEPEKKK